MAAAGVVEISRARKASGHSGHFPSVSLCDETDHTIGMSSLHPVTYPTNKTDRVNMAANSKEDDDMAIDHTVQKLFACMSIAYSSSAKLAAPQFKAYKGLRISVKDKMRLNNIVWREWYLQFIMKRKNCRRPKICNFLPQMEGTHTKPTIILLEGKYWKRNNEVVKNEYMKWRVFYKERMKHWKPDSRHVTDSELLARVGKEDQRTIDSFVQAQSIRAQHSPLEMSKDDYQMDLSDDIFATLQSLGFPQQTNRDLLMLESSDLIQPELIGLQPELDLDFTNSEPLQDLLADAMSLHMDQIRFTSGQKRPVFPDLSTVLDPSPVAGPAYPAYKRSRSSTLQSPADTDLILNGLSEEAPVHQDNIYNRYPMGRTNNMVTPVSTVNSLHMTHNSVNYQGRRLQPTPAHGGTPQQVTVTHDSSQSISQDYATNLVTSQGKYISQSQARQSTSPPYYSSINSAHNNDFVTAAVPSPYFSPPLPTNSRTSGSAGYPDALPTHTSYQRQQVPAGNMAHTSPPARHISPPARRARKVDMNAVAADRVHTTHHSSGITPSSHLSPPARAPVHSAPQPDAEVFKKPQRIAALTRLKPEEKSSFLTQLLRKPLDKEEVGSSSTTPLTSPDHTNIHPVYFPQFTPISYNPTPQTPSELRSPSLKHTNNRNGNDEQTHSAQMSTSAVITPDTPTLLTPEEDKKEGQTAEQKRRQQIKTGFEVLSTLIPTIATSTTSKASKATMLSKTIDFISQLQQEEESMKNEMSILSSEIAALDMSISRCQGKLPTTGIPMMSQHRDHMDSMLNSYIAEQTRKNWKFYMFSKLTGPLFDSFYSMVSTSTLDDMYRSTQAWVDQHCSLVSLRPALLSSLRDICAETSILTDPSRFPAEARQASLSTTGRSSRTQQVGSCPLPDVNSSPTSTYTDITPTVQTSTRHHVNSYNNNNPHSTNYTDRHLL